MKEDINRSWEEDLELICKIREIKVYDPHEGDQ